MMMTTIIIIFFSKYVLNRNFYFDIILFPIDNCVEYDYFGFDCYEIVDFFNLGNNVSKVLPMGKST